MEKCDKCNKQFTSEGLIQYGLRKGKTYCFLLCKECKSSVSKEEVDLLISKSLNNLNEV